jgi:hypothetical protein
MVTLEFRLPEGPEADRFDTALYRFIERSDATGADDAVSTMQSTPLLDHVHKAVTFARPSYASAFNQFWATFPRQG